MNKKRPKSWQRDFANPQILEDSETKTLKNSFIQEFKPKKPQIKKDERGKSLFEISKYPLTDFYLTPEQLTCFKQTKKPKKLQFFESKVKRFLENKEKIPGPGDYNLDNYYEKYHKVAFHKSSCPRFKDTNSEKPKEDMISIIDHNVELKPTQQQPIFTSFPSAFGSSTKRFIEKDKVWFKNFLN